MRLLLRWLLVLLVLTGTPALAVDYPPRPAGPVLDQADILPAAQEAALDKQLRDYNARTGRSILVATVPSLQGETIEMYSVRLFEAWGIGGKESDQGLLLLVAPNEREVRIEVGYGLHQYVTDALSGRIIRGEIAPRFKQGDMPGGIAAGVKALITQLDRTPQDAKAVAEAAAAAAADARSAGEPATIHGVLFWIVLILFFTFVFGRRRSGFRSSGLGPGIVLWGASEALRHRGGGGFDFGGGGGFGGFGGGGSGGGGASGSW